MTYDFMSAPTLADLADLLNRKAAEGWKVHPESLVNFSGEFVVMISLKG